jgi:hypothetical protein
MAEEGSLRLPTEGGGKRIRSFIVEGDVLDSDGQPLDLYEQVLILADADGNLVRVHGNDMRVYDSKIAELLQQILIGQAHLLVLLTQIGKPTGDQREIDRFIDRALKERT